MRYASCYEVKLMCKNCKRLETEINELREQLEKEKEYKEGNYKAYQELKAKFEKLAVAYCYEVELCNPLE